MYISKPQLPPKGGYVEIELPDGTCHYRNITTGQLLEDEQREPTFDEKKVAKLAAINHSCDDAIVKGCHVTLTDGTEGNISLTAEDQINLSEARLAVLEGGATAYPYHLDGRLCTVFSKADILIMAEAAAQHKLYHTTYCNHLRTWAKWCETQEELETIFYGADLPTDLAQNMAGVMASVGLSNE